MDIYLYIDNQFKKSYFCLGKTKEKTTKTKTNAAL